MAIKDILIEQMKYELTYILGRPYIKRQISPIFYDNSLIKVIMGPRRSGKSFYAIHNLQEKGKFAYINFEDIRLTRNLTPEILLNTIQDIYGDTEYIFLDEIQNLEQWENFVLFFQRRGKNLTITGSNSQLLSGDLATKLTGRYIQVIVFPFSFEEYLSAKKIPNINSDLEMESYVHQYLENGGYPATIVENLDRYRYLRDLFDAILMKDIRNRYEIRKPGLLEDFTRYLLTNITQELSYNRVAEKLHTTPDTLISYFMYLEETFLLFAVPRYSEKMHEQIVYSKKVYAIDTGLASLIGFKILDNEDRFYENIVAIQLHIFELRGELKLFYWKSPQHYEIEFVVKKGTKVTALIQVSFDITNESTKRRETRALIIGSSDLECDNLIIISKNVEKTELLTWQNVSRSIRFIPLWKWLTQPNLFMFENKV